MKKNFAKIFLACLVCAVMLCVAVSAETTVVPGDDGKYDVTYNGTSGEYYAILVVEGTYAENETPTISEDSIIYISQETAGADGNATFADFLPKTATEGTIYIGGSDLDKAVLFGYLSTGIEETATVSGTVTSGSAWEATVTLTDSTDAQTVFTVETAEGAYEISVPFGTYNFKVEMNAHLTYAEDAVEISEDVADKNVSLLGGDITADGAIDHLDLGRLLGNYNKISEECDITGDNAVNHLDLGKLLLNYKKAYTTEA